MNVSSLFIHDKLSVYQQNCKLHVVAMVTEIVTDQWKDFEEEEGEEEAFEDSDQLR